MAILKNTVINDNGYLQLPSGTTSQRPFAPAPGHMRWNTTIGGVEVHNGSEWVQLPYRETSYSPPSAGMVMYVDANNSESYPGSGTTWTDLSGNNHNLSLGSGVSYSSDFNGVLTFAKNSTGYARNTSMNLSSSNFTVISYVRKLTNGDNGRTITAYSNNWLLAHHDNTYGDYYAEGWVNNIASPTSDTTWRMYTGTGNISTNTYQLYLNSSLEVSNNLGSQGPNGWNINNQYSQYSDCQIGNLLVYNRVLSAAEIQDIYNNTRARFGL